MTGVEVEAVYVPSVPLGREWCNVPAYELAYSLDRGGFPQERGAVRFAWNEQGLFVRAELEDSFLIANIWNKPFAS